MVQMSTASIASSVTSPKFLYMAARTAQAQYNSALKDGNSGEEHLTSSIANFKSAIESHLSTQASQVSTTDMNRGLLSFSQLVDSLKNLASLKLSQLVKSPEFLVADNKAKTMALLEPQKHLEQALSLLEYTSNQTASVFFNAHVEQGIRETLRQISLIRQAFNLSTPGRIQ